MARRFINIKELAEYLGMSRGTLYVWVCHKKIPHLKIGGLVKFDMSDIEKWIRRRRIKELH